MEHTITDQSGPGSYVNDEVIHISQIPWTGILLSETF